MEIIKYISLILDAAIIAYFGWAALYFLVFALAAKFYREKTVAEINPVKRKVSVLLPAYKEDSVILQSAKSALKHKSIHEVEVVVIADSLQPLTLEKINDAGAKVIPVNFEKSTKAKSLNVALSMFPVQSDISIVLDADNIMADGFVDDMVAKIDSGYKVVQGHRTAKNDNTHFAVLDGLSEEINNSIFRKGHRVLGISAALIGSAFACETHLLQQMMKKITATGGFDKELELDLLEKKITVAYANSALVYDEKVQQPNAFVNQRRRWLSAQFIFFAKNIKRATIQLFKHGNIGFADKTAQFIMPPRIITLGVTALMFTIHALAILFLKLNFQWFMAWTLVFATTILAVLLSIPAKMYNYKLVQSLLSLPLGLWLTVKALLKLKGADKKFIHTPHGISK